MHSSLNSNTLCQSADPFQDEEEGDSNLDATDSTDDLKPKEHVSLGFAPMQSIQNSPTPPPQPQIFFRAAAIQQCSSTPVAQYRPLQTLCSLTTVQVAFDSVFDIICYIFHKSHLLVQGFSDTRSWRHWVKCITQGGRILPPTSPQPSNTCGSFSVFQKEKIHIFSRHLHTCSEAADEAMAACQPKLYMKYTELAEEWEGELDE